VLKNEKGVTGIANVFNGSTLLSKVRTVATFAASALPVNFLGFNATRQDNTALLTWKVNGEINVNKYVVERSADGNAFTAIGEILASTTSANEKEYHFTDQQILSGNNYYRIVEKDFDGRSTYSIIRVITLSGSGLIVKLSPVPTFNHTVRLEVVTTGNASMTATLVNTLGQQLKAFNIRQGVNSLDLGEFSKGVYYLRVQTGDNNAAIRKIVIE
jgi:hypothetical protein